jgi:hypothetical protein
MIISYSFKMNQMAMASRKKKHLKHTIAVPLAHRKSLSIRRKIQHE